MSITFSERTNACYLLRRLVVAVHRIGMVLILQTCVAADSTEQETQYSILAPMASRSLLLDVAATDDQVVVVGERGHVLLADQPKGPWKQSRVPTRVTLTAVYFHDRRLGWAVGHDAVILRTIDGGRNWNRVHDAPEEEAPLLDVWFRDDQYGIAVGAYGLYLISSNGGLRWSRSAMNLLNETSGSQSAYQAYDGLKKQSSSLDERISDSFDAHLNSIVGAANGSLYIAAEAGGLYRSDDDGRSWIRLNSPYHGSFSGILPLMNERLLAYGLRGNMYLSEDSGRSWRRIETTTKELLTDGLYTTEGRIIIVGLGGTVLIGDDKGRNFSLVKQASRKGLSAVVRARSGELVVVGEMGVETLQIGDFELWDFH